MIPVFRPTCSEEEIEAVTKVLRSGWWGLGPKTMEFEERFAEFVGAKYAVALNSATAALHLSLLSLGIGKGDEVLVPPITFVSTAHAVLYCQATPVFVDVYPDTLNISIEDIEKKITTRTKAIIPVHYGGHPCKMDEIMELAQRHELAVVEDAAHACGSEYKGRKIGSIGDLTCFSFHAVKNLATGDGGMITTDIAELGGILKRLRWLGIDKGTWDRTEDGPDFTSYGWYYEVLDLGFKYHMNDITAALGLVQLQRLEANNKRRREIAAQYQWGLNEISWVECPIEKEYISSAWHNYVIKTPHRDALHIFLRDKGISTGVHYVPIHLHPYYQEWFRTILPIAEKVWTQLLTLPMYPDLTDHDVADILGAIQEFGKWL